MLVLGGGFVAYRTVRRLRGSIKRGEVRVTVVTRDNALAVHGLIGEMVTGRILASTVLNPGRRVFAPARLHVAEIESIDIEAAHGRHEPAPRRRALRAGLRPRGRLRRQRREPRELPGARGACVPPEELPRLLPPQEPRPGDARARGHRDRSGGAAPAAHVLRRRRRLLGDGARRGARGSPDAAHAVASTAGSRERSAASSSSTPGRRCCRSCTGRRTRSAPNGATRVSSSTR